MASHYILFSGGYDSTYVVASILKSIKTRKETADVHLVMVESNFSGAKVAREVEARTKLIEHWRNQYKDYGNLEIVEHKLKIDVTEFPWGKIEGLAQPLFWLPALMSTINYVDTRRKHIYICNIAEDDEMIRVDSIRNIIYESARLCYYPDKINDSIWGEDEPFVEKRDKVRTEDFISIHFPLATFMKPKIIEAMLHNYRDEFKLVTTCEYYDELPEGHKTCGLNCKPCRDVFSACLILRALFLRDIHAIKDQKEIDETTATYNKKLNENVEIIDDLIDDILKYGKYELPEPEPEECNVESCVDKEE